MEPANEPDTGAWDWVELHEGPLDGELAWCRIDGDDPGTALLGDLSDLSADGPGGRSWYEPDPDGTWRWQGDSA